LLIETVFYKTKMGYSTEQKVFMVVGRKVNNECSVQHCLQEFPQAVVGHKQFRECLDRTVKLFRRLEA
jgi:hypothetical protein